MASVVTAPRQNKVLSHFAITITAVMFAVVVGRLLRRVLEKSR